ncbi:NHS-like protein 3 isoform X2 [Gouania willdenowi]|uniref:Uncharacterized protein n=1 Tax=Gouania willdenowi TaxID=441366 RepID=A0A8C5G8T2_GOUWI|nr:uncharacterized protein KIAA1522 homolog isoform X2 [Gouania willdenowi]
MGNSIQKKNKKIHRENNSSSSVFLSSDSSLKWEKPKGFWLLGHSDKQKTAGPKGHDDQKRLAVHYTASQHLQENVFIEGSRPQYLEDLHTEALEGLKIQRQEENQNGLNLPDDESIASADTLCAEQDSSSQNGGGSLNSRSTTRNSDTTVTSAMSSRPVLTRQGSTFKPLNQVKRFDKNKKRSRRTTIMGIPNQVQKELALHRSSTFQPLMSAQFRNQDINSHFGIVIIPMEDEDTLLAKKAGARIHLSDLEAFGDDQLMTKHFQEICQDEQSFNYQRIRSNLHHSSKMRPKSLAVPGMTTSSSSSSSMLNFLQEPQGPVMTVSPQATYLSTIIPNAVMPASVEVIEIDRSNSRTRGSSINQGGSVRTVSKNSLTSGELSVSPLLSRRSDDGSQNDSVLMSKSLSGSNWSESQCSQTIVSGSSPRSSKSSTQSSCEQSLQHYVRECHTVQTGVDQVSVCDSVSSSNSPNERSVTGQGLACGGQDSITEELSKNKRNINRSLSIIKTKQPPAPPRRTNSLHSNKISNKIRDVSEAPAHTEELNIPPSEETTTGGGTILKEDLKCVKANTACNVKPASIPNSTNVSNSSATTLMDFVTTSSGDGGIAEPSLETNKTTPSEEAKFERTMSPSSGYSSQSGTPTLSPKEISPTSPDKQRKTPVKPERSLPRFVSTPGSPSHSLTSLSSETSEPSNPDISACDPSISIHRSPHMATATELPLKNNSSPFRHEIKELLNIPPPPKVKAPSPPLPETWACNKQTLALLCGRPSNVTIANQKPAPVLYSMDKQKIYPTDVKEKNHVGNLTTDIDKPVLHQSEGKTNPGTLVATYHEGLQKILKQDESLKQEFTFSQTVGEQGLDLQSGEKDDSSGVIKELHSETLKKQPPPVMKKPTKLLHREETSGTQRTDTCSSATPIAQISENPTVSSQSSPSFTDDKKNEASSKLAFSLQVPITSKTSSTPSPPPAHHPKPPLSSDTPPSSVSSLVNNAQEKTQAGESCWPPPPPPLENDLVFEDTDEVDFPPPPPLFIVDSVADLSTVKGSDLDKGSLSHSPDLLTGIIEPVITNNMSVVIMQDLSTNSGSVEVSLQGEQNINSVLDNVSPPSLDSQTQPITRAESLVSASTSHVLSNFPRHSFAEELPLSSVTAELLATTAAPLLPAESTSHGVNFRRQPNVPHRDSRNKELLARHKSAPIPKEDANIPLVTPSLLQMVRLRAVSMAEDQTQVVSEDIKSSPEVAPTQDSSQSSLQGLQNIPQKPIRKSLSMKSHSAALKTPAVTMSTPSMRLQEAIRMKTAAMSSRDVLPSRMAGRSPFSSSNGEPGALCLRSPEGTDMHMSSACTASFIFSRSTKKVVVETPSSSEAQARLRQSLASELLQVSDQSKANSFSNGGVKWDRVPPPVAKKPAQGRISPSQHIPSYSLKMDPGVEGKGECQPSSGITLPQTTTRVTEDTIETLF